MLSPTQEDSTADSGSKGSPNEEKCKQIYKNLLAQQCLGEDVFSMMPEYENLSNPLLNGISQGQTNENIMINDLNNPIVNPYYDQHSSISTNGACQRTYNSPS